MGVLTELFALIRAFLTPRFVLVVENLALRHQLTVLSRSVKRPKLRPGDRLFWVVLSRLWQGWRASLHMVQPATVVRWHREGFKRYWRWRSRCKKPGRRAIESEIRDLPMAESVPREADRVDTSRVFGSLHRAKRGPSAPDPE